jgi:uncharacterized integral membrane protein
MIRRFLSGLLLIALAVVLAAFAVANRKDVAVGFDPFDPAHSALLVTGPLYLVIFIVMIVGVVVGGCASWLQQAKWRRRARWSDTEIAALRARLNAPPAPESRPAARLTIPPAA